VDKWILLRFLGTSFRVAFWPLALVFVGGFPIREGVTLGLLMALLFFVLTGEKGGARFVPYWVQVTPDWYQILTDLKLVSGPEEWRSIRESVSSSTSYSVLRDGLLFTVVQQGGGKAGLPAFHREMDVAWQEVEDFDAGMNERHPPLIFWNQRRVFGAEFLFREDMTPIQFEEPDPIRELLGTGYRPAVFFMGLHCTYTENPHGSKYRPGVLGGLDIGIEVPVGWWEKVKGSFAPVGRVDDSHPETGSVRLSLATIPLSEFTVYRDAGDRKTSEYWLKTEPRIRKRRDAARQELGWTVEEHEDGGRPTSIGHRYFTVRHGTI
jgi:hypothetical protein